MHLQSQRGLVICRICPHRHRGDRGDRCPIPFSRGEIEAMVDFEAPGYVGKVESRGKR